jgi:hypothetical protein
VRADRTSRAVGDAGTVLDGREIGDHIRELERLLSVCCLAERVGDEVRRLRNGLVTVRDHWPEDDADAIANAERVGDVLEELIADAAAFTIPNRLKEALVGLAVGRALNFDTTFADELPDAKQRSALLARLAAYESLFHGAIDVENGVVYKMSPSRGWRVASYLSPLIFAALAGGFLALIGTLDQLQIRLDSEWGLDEVPPLLGAYLLVLAGALIHLVVENVKQAQSDKVPILAIGDGLEWLHLRWAGLGLSFIPVLVTVVGLRVAGVGSDPSDVPIYLFAGYSVDSVAGLFLTRFDASARRGLKSIRKLIGGGSDGEEDDRPRRHRGNRSGRTRPRQGGR